jgi:L-lactate utilization protein LutC
MKIKVTIYFAIAFLISQSCQTKQEKTIQTELDKIEGQWKINSFLVTGQNADEWKDLLKTGEIVFKSCRAKNVKHSNTYCGGEIQVNSSIYSINYRFDTNFIFSVRALSKDGSGIIKMTDEEARVTSLLSGNWEIIVNDNTLMAKQLKNNAFTGALASFTAMRK